MTRKPVAECAKTILNCYGRASKEDEGRILDEFCKTRGYNDHILRPLGNT